MVNKPTKRLFIEGTDDETNGNLREAFYTLLFQKLEGKMPKIKMGNGKQETIDHFLNGQLKGERFLLVDLDSPKPDKEEIIKELGLKDHKDDSFFMIQEMEAWIISQPEVLNSYYKPKVPLKIPQRPAHEILNPSDFLSDIVKNTNKGTYHKVKDGVALMKLLDADKIEKDFEDFKQLIRALSL